jgi:hypothetical protein
MSKVEVDQITQQSGTTLTVGGGACKTATVDATTVTLGRSGGTVSLASGATQSGFGRTGTVDWQTGDIKTATFTATNGEGYFCNTTSGAFTVNLPAGSAGAIVSVADYTRTFNTNNLTVSPNGSEKIGGVAADAKLTVNGQSATFVYVDGTEGWINVQETESSQTGIPPFLVATGGTITECGDCKIHTFTGPGTFTVCNVAGICGPTRNQVSYLVVAGGGGGGSDVGGGAGAGGFREDKSPLTPYTASPLEGAGSITVTATAFPITVGGGGTGGSPAPTSSTNGANSVFSTITSAGGGGGGDYPNGDGKNGGSGGGGSGYNQTTVGGSGNTPPVSPPQGNSGGNATSPSICQTGGGGGGAVGTGSNNTSPGTAFAPGGAGASTGISGSSVTYSAGGRGAGDGSPNPQAGGDNTGDGADGGGTGPLGNTGPNGGSGIVIIRYKFQ